MHQRALEDYISFYESLSQRSLPLMEKIVSKDVFFSDPFHAVHGIESMRHVFEKMFSKIKNPKFKVTDYAWGRDGHTAYIRWIFTFSTKKEWTITGMSEVMFGSDGKVTSHIDHWDSGSQIIARLPILGHVWRMARF